MSEKNKNSQWFCLPRRVGLWGLFAISIFLTPALGNFSQAKLAAQISPNTDLEAASFYQQGVMRYNRQDLQGAEALFRKAIQRDPNFASARNYLGNILLQTNRLEEATQEYSEAIRLNPNSAEAYYNLGLALQKQEQIEAAITAYRQALVVAPTMSAGYYNLGLALYQQGNLDEAISSYRQAINFDSDNINARLNLGIALQKQGKFDDAIAVYQQTIKLDQDNPRTYNNLGSLLLLQGRTQEAIEIYKQGIRAIPENPQGYYNLGLTWYNQGDTKKAKIAFRRAYKQYRQQGNYQQVTLVEQLMQQIASGKSSPSRPSITKTNPGLGNSNVNPNSINNAEDGDINSFSEEIPIKIEETQGNNTPVNTNDNVDSYSSQKETPGNDSESEVCFLC
ncbi:MAG: tetratricopeptide repeat protein [Mastigocoleus sp.]